MGHDDRLGPGAEPLASLLGSTSSRRSLLKGGIGLAAALMSPGRLRASAAGAGPLPGSTARGSLVGIDPAIAEWQFGYNNDGVHFFPLEGSSSRGIVCVNHEYTNEELFLPGLVRIETADPRQMADYVRRHPGVVPLTQAMHGISVFVIERDARRRWRHVAGTLNNCAGGQTPWGTFLTAEENVDYYFGNGAAAVMRADASVQRAHRRLPPRAASIHGWEHVDARFDLGREPTELLRFGWIVEIDPYDPAARPKKRTALGRCKHEGAATAMTRDGRLAVYTGDDDRFEYLYKFVTAERVHPTDRAANRDLLDRGVLYTARFDSDGSGRWLPLVQGQGPLTVANGFAAQADVVLRAREAADLLGATPMDRPEDVAPDAATGRVYLALTNNKDRAAASRRGEYNGRELELGPNAANPRGPNPYGHVIEIDEAGGDCGAETFRWELFLAGGELAAPSPFGSPDNLALDRTGNLWIVTDGAQPGGFNNGCYVVPTDGPERGRIRQVLSAPRGAEVCGCSFTPDGSTLLLSIQHPGEGGSLAAPTSQWPDGPGRVPRPSLIALALPQPGTA